jgi:hypothetical protein
LELISSFFGSRKIPLISNWLQRALKQVTLKTIEVRLSVEDQRGNITWFSIGSLPSVRRGKSSMRSLEAVNLRLCDVAMMQMGKSDAF